MRTPRTLTAVLAFLGICTSVAGEFGLGIDDSVQSSCTQLVEHSRNTCTSAAVVDDLRRYFVHGAPLRIEAINYFLDRNAVWMRGEPEVKTLCGALATIAADPQLKHWRELRKSIRALPYRSMHIALETQLQDQTLTAAGRDRVAEVRALVKEKS